VQSSATLQVSSRESDFGSLYGKTRPGNYFASSSRSHALESAEFMSGRGGLEPTPH
jgi:hypothetical protein